MKLNADLITFNTIKEALKIVDPTYYITHQNDKKS